MSQTGLPTPDAAYDTLFQGVHQRVFFQKLAAAGYAPRSAEEAQWMLNTAGKLRQVTEAQSVKEAAAQDNPFFRLDNSLDRVMAEFGLGGQAKQAQYQEVETAYKQAAASLANDPEIYNAVLSLKANEAEQIQAQLARN